MLRALTPSTIVISATSLPQPDHNIPLIQLRPISRRDGDAVMRKLPLDVAALDAHAGLSHDLCVLSDPDHQRELYSGALLVVGVLDAHVAVLDLAVVQLAHQLCEAARARLGERQLVADG